MKISTLLESASWRRAPDFVRNHQVFQRIKRIEKPFPKIGLPNCIERCESNFDGKPAYIGFSSNNITGFWDLLTMSMRGVCSCMHWENPHSTHLVGSVTDPFLGIVYISDGEKTPYGVSFRRRSLVRLIRSSKTGENKLLLERVYKDTGNTIPTVYNNHDDHPNTTLEVFRNFLQKRVGDKYKVILPKEREMDAYTRCLDFIPQPSSLKHLSDRYWSMSDCRAYYYRFNDTFITKFADQG